MSELNHKDSCPLRQHVARFLEADRRYEQSILEFAEGLERKGYRIVDGGQVGRDGCGWEIKDWRTQALLAEGDGGYGEYSAATDRLSPDGKWYHIDQVSCQVPLPEVQTPGVPQSLARALEEWAETEPDAVSKFIGETCAPAEETP